jgi:hypothetical protein
VTNLHVVRGAKQIEVVRHLKPMSPDAFASVTTPAPEVAEAKDVPSPTPAPTTH